MGGTGKTRMTFALVLLCILIFNFPALLSQERLKVYVIHDQLGRLINLTERNLLGLFSDIDGFRYAAFFAGEEGSYGVRILYVRDNEEKITEITFP